MFVDGVIALKWLEANAALQRSFHADAARRRRIQNSEVAVSPSLSGISKM